MKKVKRNRSTLEDGMWIEMEWRGSCKGAPTTQNLGRKDLNKKFKVKSFV